MNKITLKALSLLILLPLFVIASPDARVLFVLFDAGETNALLPVIDTLEEEEVAILAFGTSRKLLNSRKQISLDIPEQVDSSWDRCKPLSKESVQKITQSLHPEIVITGVVSALQGQFLDAYAREGEVTLYAYRDNLNHGTSGWYAFSADIQRHIPASENAAVLFPSQMTADQFKGEPYQRLVVGKPSFEKLRNKLLDPEFRAQARKKLGIENERLLVWVGGYDEPGRTNYTNALTLFKRSTLPSNIRVIFHHHPKIAENAWSLIEVLAASDIIATYQSSVGLDAVLCGKQVLYFVPTEDKEFTPPIELQAGWATRISSPEQLMEALQHQSSHENPLEKLGLPLDSISRFQQLLKM